MGDLKTRETILTDILVVGGGPAGLATAIRLADLCVQESRQPSIFLIEKGALIGSHILSGAIVNPRSLRVLLPEVSLTDLPFETPVLKEEVVFFTPSHVFKSPFIPPYMGNRGNYICSLGKLTAWLSKIAEKKGIQIFAGVSGHELLIENNKIVGVRCGDTGVDERGIPQENYEPGADIRAKLVILAEGVHGHLTKSLRERKGLDKDRNAQVYSLGVKELWEVPEGVFDVGRIIHAMGWPLSFSQFGGAFIYGVDKTKIALGLAVGLDYEDPTFDPHHAFQIFKQHPFVAALLKDGKLLRYGAKAIPEGGFFSIPKICYDGALVVGDSAGFLAMPALKGIHLAIESGLWAAEAAFESFKKSDFSEKQLSLYERLFRESESCRELWRVRNFRQGFKDNLFWGMLHFGVQLLTGGWGLSLSGRLKMPADKDRYQKLAQVANSSFQKKFSKRCQFDEKLTFSKTTDIFYSGTKHGEHQPSHLLIPDRKICEEICIPIHGAPCQHFCPAEVYEVITDEKSGKRILQLHPSNCVHCKTCDIKDPFKNINWVTPHGGDGPQYDNM